MDEPEVLGVGLFTKIEGRFSQAYEAAIDRGALPNLISEDDLEYLHGLMPNHDVVVLIRNSLNDETALAESGAPRQFGVGYIPVRGHFFVFENGEIMRVHYPEPYVDESSPYELVPATGAEKEEIAMALDDAHFA